jgi:hypothetical protein
MAGDWIKMRCELQTHPKIVRILSATKADKFRVIGGLHAVWSVFDAHSVDGVLFGYTPDTLDHVIGWEGFAKAMISVGWLVYDGSETLTLPEFGEHNGQSAKRRAEDQKRKRNGRKEDNSQEVVRNESGHIADKKRTREEKRREDKETPSGELFDEFWSAYPRKDSKADALKAFGKLKVSADFLPTILAGLERAKSSDQWTRDGGQYIPYAATWLNGKRWEDGGADDLDGNWWQSAGFSKEWQAVNAGCTAVNAHQWRDGERIGEKA